MLQAISPFSLSQSRIPNFTTLNLADAKTQKLALGFFALLTVSVGLLSLSVQGGPVLLVAIPTFVLVGMICWLITRIKDYSDPMLLQIYRNEATNLPLCRLLEEHGIYNLVHHRILAPEQLKMKFREEAQHMTIWEVIRFRKKLVVNCEKYGQSIDLPKASEFKEQWASTVAKKNNVWICRNSFIGELYEHGLVSKNFYAAAMNYQRALLNHSHETDQANRKWKKSVDDAIKFFDGFVDTLGDNPEEVTLKEGYTSAISSLRSASTAESIEKTFPIFFPDEKNSSEEVSDDQRARNEFLRGLKAANKTLQKELSNANEQLQTKTEAFNRCARL